MVSACCTRWCRSCRDRAGPRQLKNPEHRLTHNLGGQPSQNVCSISIVGLEAHECARRRAGHRSRTAAAARFDPKPHRLPGWPGLHATAARCRSARPAPGRQLQAGLGQHRPAGGWTRSWLRSAGAGTEVDRRLALVCFAVDAITANLARLEMLQLRAGAGPGAVAGAGGVGRLGRRCALPAATHWRWRAGQAVIDAGGDIGAVSQTRR